MTESSYRVCAVFTLKDSESKDRFVSFCNGENGLSITRRSTTNFLIDLKILF